MPKYLFEASYTVEGAKGLAREGGSGRQKAISASCEKLGGRLETLYYAFGKTDAFLIVDLPDNIAATALALAVNQAGAATVKTTVLIRPEEVDEAVKRTVSYRPPGA